MSTRGECRVHEGLLLMRVHASTLPTAFGSLIYPSCLSLGLMLLSGPMCRSLRLRRLRSFANSILRNTSDFCVRSRQTMCRSTPSRCSAVRCDLAPACLCSTSQRPTPSPYMSSHLVRTERSQCGRGQPRVRWPLPVLPIELRGFDRWRCEAQQRSVGRRDQLVWWASSCKKVRHRLDATSASPIAWPCSLALFGLRLIEITVWCRCEASGFCYANDIVLAILELLKHHKVQ